jgi:hypothetical protein
MVTLIAHRLFARSVPLLAVLLLCGCGMYPPTRAHVTVATVDCTLPSAAPAAGAPLPGEGGPEEAQAGEAGGGEAAGGIVELVAPSAPPAAEPAQQPTAEKAQVEPVAEMERRLADVARLIKATAADIVAVQGLPSEGALNSLRAKLSALGCKKKFSGYVFFEGEAGAPSGIAVLSSLPIISFRRPEAAPGSDLAHTECVEAHIQLPEGEELVLFSFRLHRERALQLAEAKAIYDLTLPLRKSDVNLLLAGCLNTTEPYRDLPTERTETADRIISGANTLARGDDLIDLDAYLWPDERVTGPGGAECCRIIVSPELVADTYRKPDWYLARVTVMGDTSVEGAPRAPVARFGLR